MTAIVAVVHDGKVWMGADSAGVSGWSVTTRDDAKVFVNGDFVMGFTTSFRMGQLLRWAFVPPQADYHDEKYMATAFVDGVRAALKTGGWATRENEHETGGNFLVGWRGRIWEVDSDFQVGLPAGGFAAVGSGTDLCLGAMHVNYYLPPDERIRTALAAAERFNIGVRGPFVVVREP